MLMLRACRQAATATATATATAMAPSARRGFHAARFAGMAMQTVHVPTMGDSISEGTLVQIVRAVGETVHADEVVAVLETDKVSVDVMSPVAGTVVEHLAKLEENVLVGAALFTVDDSRAPEPGSQSSSSPSSSSPSEPAAAPSPSPSPASASSSTSGHRTPLIKFLGKRSLLPSPTKTSSSSSLSAPSSVGSMRQATPSSGDVLPFQHTKKVPLSRAEVDAINSGISIL